MGADIPAWFQNTLAEGLQSLVALSLPGQPPAETIALTLDVWVHAVWRAPVQWSEQYDRARLRHAFFTISRRTERWPAPRHLIEAMPPRPEAPALPAPRISDEQRARYRANIAQLNACIKRMR